MSVAQYLPQWFESVRRSLAYNTARRYGYFVAAAVEHLGSRRLSKLSTDDVADLHTALIEEGYAPTTVKVCHTVLHHALQDAVARGLAVRNVFELVSPPSSCQ